MNYTLSSLHFENFQIVRNTISFHINLLPCYASHHLKQVRCLALGVNIFCLTIVAYNVSVSFLNVCYVGFGPVFFCTYKEYQPLINLSDSPQGHPRFDVLVTPYESIGWAHGTLPQHSCRSIHSAEIIMLHSSSIHSAAIIP